MTLEKCMTEDKHVLLQLLDNEGFIIEVNSYWLELLGYESGDVVGQHFSKFVSDQAGCHFEIQFEHLKEYGFVDNAMTLLHKKDGSSIEGVLNGTVEYDDDGEVLHSTCNIRTLDYFMNSAIQTRTLLEREKQQKKVLRVEANLAAMLLDVQEENIFINRLYEVFIEPVEVERVIIEHSPRCFMDTDIQAQKWIESARELHYKTPNTKLNLFAEKDLQTTDITLKAPDNLLIALCIHDLMMPDSVRIALLEFNRISEIHEDCFYHMGTMVAMIETGLNTIKVEAEKARLIQELEELTKRDYLTQLKNRRTIDTIINERIYDLKRSNVPFCLLMLDIDYFKKVNDTWGHMAGDKVLRGLSAVLKGLIRNTDHVGRWGGEEFIAVLPRTLLNDAKNIAEKIRSTIEKTKMAQVTHITVSIGVIEATKDETFEMLSERLDVQLYTAKELGRNRVE